MRLTNHPDGRFLCVVVIKNPSDFVGSVLGQSESNTKAILATTVGKVLVIDEVSLSSRFPLYSAHFLSVGLLAVWWCIDRRQADGSLQDSRHRYVGRRNSERTWGRSVRFDVRI